TECVESPFLVEARAFNCPLALQAGCLSVRSRWWGLVLEPDLDLAFCGLDGVRTVHQVLLDLQAPVAAEVTADGAGRRRRRVCGAGEGTEALDDAVAFEDRGNNGSAEHELHERLV